MKEEEKFETGDKVFILRNNGVTKGVVIDFDDCEGRWIVLSSEDEKLLMRTCDLAAVVDNPSQD